MNPAYFQSLLLFFSIWFHLLMAHYFQPLGFKINWVLLVLVSFNLRSNNRLLPFLAILGGLCCDALSHGMIGVHGISFLLMLLITHWLAAWFYSNNVYFTVIAVFIISLAEGTIRLTLLQVMEPEILWNWTLLNRILPLSLLHALTAPIVFRVIVLLESLLIRIHA